MKINVTAEDTKPQIERIHLQELSQLFLYYFVLQTYTYHQHLYIQLLLKSHGSIQPGQIAENAAVSSTQAVKQKIKMIVYFILKNTNNKQS